ncbi:DinI-like family protein [Phytobacter sp. V91]|uniref:DinI-like family protein n=1 Tax=Phytobacter sp. V91 TaxID=3369425 RepID=UPI003F5D6757
MRINITLDKEQKIAPALIDSFRNELSQRVLPLYPKTQITIKKGSSTGTELLGFETTADWETVGMLLQEVWEDESWRS